MTFSKPVILNKWPKEYTQDQKNLMNLIDTKSLSKIEEQQLRNAWLTIQDVANYKSELQKAKTWIEWISSMEDIVLPSKLTEWQSNSYSFANRMAKAQENLWTFDDKFKKSWTTSEYLTPRWIMPNFLKSNERQIYENNKRIFINSTLRKESWATITNPEFENAEKQYFPQPWDSNDVIDQKANLRHIATLSMYKAVWKDEEWRDIGNIYTQLLESKKQQPTSTQTPWQTWKIIKPKTDPLGLFSEK